MKKQLLLLAFALVSFAASSQVSLPNGAFENWTTGTYDFPQFYPGNSNPQTFYQCHTPFNCTKSTDYFHGNFALQLTTNAMAPDTCFGYITDAANANGGPSSWTGGAPITEKPTGIRGYYKYNVASADSAIIIVVARKAGANIGTYFYTIGGVHATYSMFQFTFMPALTMIPDSIIFATASSNAMLGNGIPGSTLIMDSVSFTGITTQPAQINGDFENWQSQTLESPNTWISNSGGGNGTNGISKTTDKVAGNYAIDLMTYQGDRNGTPVAQGAGVSTGYWDNMCSCQKGGYPFSNMVDTLAFWYKYTPMGGDSAQVYLNFKSGGSMFSGAGMALHAAATYQYMEIPFNLMSAPDSVIVGVQSSSWNDSLLSFVGSELKIDEMHFKTQPLTTGINAYFNSSDVKVYPNPFTSTATIDIAPSINISGMQLRIMDVLGRTISKTSVTNHKMTIDRTDIINGVYFYELITSDKVVKTGKIIIE